MKASGAADEQSEGESGAGEDHKAREPRSSRDGFGLESDLQIGSGVHPPARLELEIVELIGNGSGKFVSFATKPGTTSA